MNSVLLSLASLLAACASEPRALRFGPDSPMGLLVVTAPKSAYAHSADFRRVNLDENRFGDGVTTLDASAWSGEVINTDGELYLAVKLVEPGDYVLQGLFTSRGAARFGGCTAEGGPVYAVEPGRVTIIRADASWRALLVEGAVPDVNDQTVLNLFDAARTAGDHDMHGPVSIARPSALIRWTAATGWTRECVRESTFTRLE